MKPALHTFPWCSPSFTLVDLGGALLWSDYPPQDPELQSLWSAPTTCWLMSLITQISDSSHIIPTGPSSSQPPYFSFWDCYASFPYIHSICLVTSSWPLSSSAHNYLGSNVYWVRDTQWKRLIHSLKLVLLTLYLVKDNVTKANSNVVGFRYKLRFHLYNI